MWLTKQHIETIFLFGLLAIASLTSCNNKEEKIIVAKAFDNVLYLSDIENIAPKGLSPEDSATIVDNYIDQWVQQMVLLEKARRNVDDSFDDELRNYKNSLITYSYERQIVDQLLDTVVTEEQIADYYADHQDNFVLSNSIVKAVYVLLPAGNAPTLLKLRATMSKKELTDEDIMALHEHTSHCISSYLDNLSWLPLFKLQSEIPIQLPNEEVMLRNKRLQEYTNDSTTCLLRIIDHKKVGELSPLEMEYAFIKDIILNARSVDIVRNMRIDLCKEAEIDGNVVFYNK